MNVQGQKRLCRVEVGPKLKKPCLHVYKAGKSYFFNFSTYGAFHVEIYLYKCIHHYWANIMNSDSNTLTPPNNITTTTFKTTISAGFEISRAFFHLFRMKKCAGNFKNRGLKSSSIIF